MNDTALRLAERIDFPSVHCGHEAAAELRRLHAENEALREANEAFSKRQEWWNDKMVALEALNDELVEALRGCVTALDALWQPADSIYTRASDAAERALAKAGVSNGS